MLPALTSMLLGGGLSLGSDILNSFTDEANAKGGQTSAMTSREYGDVKNPLDAQIAASKGSRGAIVGLQKQLNNAATGETGEAARQEFDIQHGQLGPSAAARNAAAAQRQDASTLRNLGAVQGQSNLRQAAQQNKSMRADVMNALRGGSPASKAAALSNYSSQNAQNNAGLFNQALQSQSSNLAQAGSLEGAASQGLDASKQSNYATEVVPFLNQQGDYVGSENAATQAGATAAQNFVETQKQNKMNTKDSFQTIKSLLGGLGQGAAETGLFGALFNEDKLAEDAKNKKGIAGLIGAGGVFDTNVNIPNFDPLEGFDPNAALAALDPEDQTKKWINQTAAAGPSAMNLTNALTSGIPGVTNAWSTRHPNPIGNGTPTMAQAGYGAFAPGQFNQAAVNPTGVPTAPGYGVTPAMQAGVPYQMGVGSYQAGVPFMSPMNNNNIQPQQQFTPPALLRYLQNRPQ